MCCLFYREFYYIQMEKYARQALSEGVKSDQDLQIHEDSELYRVLNVHYNRNNHIEVSNWPSKPYISYIFYVCEEKGEKISKKTPFVCPFYCLFAKECVLRQCHKTE